MTHTPLARAATAPRALALLGLLLALLPAAARAQSLVRPESHPGGILLVVTDKSGLVSNDSPLYVASNAVGWNAGDPAMKLSGRSDLRWQILLQGPPGGGAAGNDARLEFKFTRGSWETCEVAEDLADISNRTLRPVDPSVLEPGKPYIVELTIERFADEREGAARPAFRTDSTRPLNVTGEAFRVQVVGGAGGAGGSMRDVTVWLPPGYDDEPDRRYPVLYMQDGQHVFDISPPTPGEWGADETATALIQTGQIEPVIIVAIPNSGANRAAEYLPGRTGLGVPESEFTRLGEAIGVAPDGDAYLAWVVREVAPRVERIVRASTDPADRGFGGASLGGLITLRAAQLHPGTFGRFLCESPSLTARGRDLVPALTEGLDAAGARVFVGIGDSEHGDSADERSRALVEAAKDLTERLGQSGGDAEVSLLIRPDAQHNEAAWAERFDDALRHLYPASRE